MIDAKVLTIGFDAISKKMSENRIQIQQKTTANPLLSDIRLCRIRIISHIRLLLISSRL